MSTIVASMPKCSQFAVCAMLGFLLSCTVICNSVLSEEPYERFLQKLRDEQLFDLGLVYLNGLETQAGVSIQFKADIEIERALLLYQSAAILSPANPEREQKLDLAEQSLRSFLERKKAHRRRGEARLKLGELLLTRAGEAVSAAEGDDSKDNPEAIKFYGEAHKLFESSIQELAGILEKIKGARTDPSDRAKVDYRQKVQQNLRQAQLLSAKSVEDRGRSRAKATAARKADLEKALKMFSDLYTKEQRMVGVRNYALYYRSMIQTDLQMPDDAIDGFQRIADLEGVDVLRPLQTSAVSELIQLLVARGKFPLAVDRAEKWIQALRPDERASAETMSLKLRLARSKLAWSEALRKRDPEDRVASRLVRDTRSELRSMLRVPGGHLEEVRELLGQLGVESNDDQPSDELPDVKDFAEAYAEAQKRIDRADTDALGVAVLREQGKATEAQAAQEKIDTAQKQAISLLAEALRLYGKDDDREQRYSVRYLMAYLLLKQQRPWEAVAIAEFLSRSRPGTDEGLQAAGVALGALSDLLRTAGESEKVQLTAHLEPFAEYLVKTWPESAQAAAAASALVQLALIGKQWDKADEFLSLVPDGGVATAKLRREAGAAFYAKYLQEKKLSGEETEQTKKLKSRALELLQRGTQGISAKDLDQSAIGAINARVGLLLIDERDDDAATLLLDSKQSPIKALSSKPSIASTTTAMESYRMAIRVVIARLTAGKIESNVAAQQTRAYIEQLQQLAAADADGQRKLSGIFIALATDLKDQLGATKDRAKRKRLSQALLIVAVEAAKSETFNTQFWGAETIVSIADEQSSDRANRQLVDKAYADAAEILDRSLAKEKEQPGWIQPEGFDTRVRLLLANSKRGMGDYKGAMNQLTAILRKNGGLIDVQIEAARTYQKWADAGGSLFYKAAIVGGRPDPKTRKNLVWGWGKIQQMVANNPNFSEQFYEARYELARSRYKYAAGLQQADKKKDEFRKAERDITSTASLYPGLGGTAMKRKFDSLLKVIQKAQGKPQKGLSQAAP